jgi:hypothetical protein
MEKSIVDVADKAVDKLGAGVEALAQAFQKLAPHVWRTMVKQQVVEGCVAIGTLVFALLFFGFCSYKFWRMFNEGEESYEDSIFVPLTVLSAILFGVAVVVSFIVIPQAILWISNPQYYAAMELARLLK